MRRGKRKRFGWDRTAESFLRGFLVGSASFETGQRTEALRFPRPGQTEALRRGKSWESEALPLGAPDDDCSTIRHRSNSDRSASALPASGAEALLPTFPLPDKTPFSTTGHPKRFNPNSVFMTYKGGKCFPLAIQNEALPSRHRQMGGALPFLNQSVSAGSSGRRPERHQPLAPREALPSAKAISTKPGPTGI